MSAEKNLALIKQVMGDFMNGSPQGLLDNLTEGAVIKTVIAPGTPISGEFRGREGFLAYFANLDQTVETLSVNLSSYLAGGDQVVLLGQEQFRVRRTGVVTDSEVALVFTLEDGKIAKLVALLDTSSVFEAYCRG